MTQSLVKLLMTLIYGAVNRCGFKGYQVKGLGQTVVKLHLK